MAEDDEFGALYGISTTEHEDTVLYNAPAKDLAPEIVEGDEADLYQQLYGEAAPEDELEQHEDAGGPQQSVKGQLPILAIACEH